MQSKLIEPQNPSNSEHFDTDYAISRNLTPFVSMQNHYSLIYREEEREMMPTLKVCSQVFLICMVADFYLAFRRCSDPLVAPCPGVAHPTLERKRHQTRRNRHVSGSRSCIMKLVANNIKAFYLCMESEIHKKLLTGNFDFSHSSVQSFDIPH